MATKKVFNHAHVVYQMSASDNDMANSAIVVHLDNGGTMILSQEESDIVIDCHRGNLKLIIAAMQKVLDLAEQDAQKKGAR